MITKILKIKNFGIFNNFNGNDLPEFKQLNLIYGWNYSGKTTLSRIFRCLEKGKLHDDYLNATFEIVGENGKYDNNFTSIPNIRVFNSDFVKENIQWDSENIEPIFLLGADSIELQKDLKIKEVELLTAEADQLEAKNSVIAKKNRINIALTNKAREITNILSLGRSFDRDKLKQVVESVKDNVTKHKISNENFEKLKTKAISNEIKPLIGKIVINIVDLEKIKIEVEKILHSQALSTNKILKLLDNKFISDWVEAGKNIHKDKTNCEFCGNRLPYDLLTKLNEHFSNDYDRLNKEIENYMNKLVNSKIEITSLLPAETAFYSDLLSDYLKIKKSLESEITHYNDSIISLIKDLEIKKSMPFDKLDFKPFIDNKTKLNNALTNLNSVILLNEQRTSDFTTEKSAAIERLKLYFAAEFEVDEKYSEIQKQIGSEENAIENQNLVIEEKKQLINLVKSQLDETVKGANLVNTYLEILFGRNDVRILPTEDKKFQLLRGDEIAKNLSEGERTAISFAYFTAKIIELNNKLSDTIIYIDDPISSLDTNHLFNIYSFIKNLCYEIKDDPITHKKIKIFRCKQLFISTHNFDFHNLIYDWFKVKTVGKDKQEFLIIQRQLNENKNESVIKTNDNLLTSYNSEYAYLFSILYKFQLNPNANYEFLYHLPNVARRFVESFLSFKFLENSNIEGSISLLIKNPVECERARKFMHYYSHNLTTEKHLKFTDLSECKEIIEIIMSSIENLDSIHFASLKNLISSSD